MPCLLIASPQMRDPHFERCLVLVWHHDEDGAVGVVINRPLNYAIGDVLSIDEAQDANPKKCRVYWGGPVEPATGTVVTRGPVKEDEGWPCSEVVTVTRSEEALRYLIEGDEDVLLMLGYSGWGAGQLDKEIEEGGWLWTDIDPELIFDMPVEGRYDLALASLGLTTSTVWMTPIQE